MPSIYISKQSGLWNDVNTWSIVDPAVVTVGQTFFGGMSSSALSPVINAPAAPASFGGDKIIIATGHTVEYNVVGCFGDQTSSFSTVSAGSLVSTNAIIISGGTLKASRTVNTELTAQGNIFINAFSTFDWGTKTDPITAVNANITLHYMAPWKGDPIGALSASQGGAGIYLFGNGTENVPCFNNIYMNGIARRRTTTLTASALMGSNVIQVANATNWAIGDTICVASELITNRSLNSTGTLSACTITGINGNSITLSRTMNTTKGPGTAVGNFTSNVNVRSWNPTYASYGIYIYPTTASNIIDINNISLNGIGAGITATVGWVTNSYTGVRSTAAQTSSPIGAISFNNVFAQLSSFTIKGLALENFWGHTQHYGYYVTGKWSERMTLEDCVAFCPNSNGFFALVNTQCNVLFKDCTLINGVNGINLGTTVPNLVTMENCNIDASDVLGTNLNGLTLNVLNSKLRGTTSVAPLDAIQKATIKNSAIYHTTTTGGIIRNNVNASGSLNFSDCTFYGGNSTTLRTPLLSSVTKGSASANNKSAQSAEITVFRANNNPLDFRRFNYYHYSQADFNVKRRGLSSFRIKPEVANVSFDNYFTLEGVIDTPQRIKGSLRFDSNYTIGSPPVINFSGAGVNETFVCGPTANVWQDFDINFTPTTTDDITMTITCRSSATNGFVWFDGVPIFPYIQNVRHYGFVYDKNVDRTVNALNTLTENQVSALNTIRNLDELYDAASYWTLTNPTLTSYVDLFTSNGELLDFGSKNLIINNFGAALTYLSATDTIILDAANLSGGNNFSSIKTTGTVTLSTGVISYLDINANIVQNTPTSLSGVYMLNSANTYTYNTNTATEVEFKDCNVYGLQNNGTAIVTIKKTGTTTITESDAEIVTYAPTLINLTLQGGYVALYDNTSTRQYYQNTDGTIVLPAAATGTWTYKVARYGYELVAGSFNVNQSTGGTIEINPSYVPDTFITEQDATIVAAYTDLNTTAKIHDYISYIRTTSAGIDYGTLHTQSFGTLTFNHDLTLDATAASVFDYSGGVITLKSSSITDDIIYFVDGDFTQSNGNTISDGIKIRANNLDSEFYFNNVDSLIFFPTDNDKNNNTNPGTTITSETIFRFLYGATVSGVTFSGNAYIRVTVAGTTLLNTTPINQGSNTIDFGTTGNIQVIINNQKVINQGVQKASKLIPHSTNI